MNGLRTVLGDVTHNSEDKPGFRIADILSPDFGYRRTEEKNLAMYKLLLQLHYPGRLFSSDSRPLISDPRNNNLSEGLCIPEDHKKYLSGNLQHLESSPSHPSPSSPEEYSWLKSTRYSSRISSKTKHRKSKRKLSSGLNSPPVSISPPDLTGAEVFDRAGVLAEHETCEDRRHRTAFTSEQLSLLHQEFIRNAYLTEDRRHYLAGKLNLTETQIKIWFQNRRAKLKKSTPAWDANSQGLNSSILSM